MPTLDHWRRPGPTRRQRRTDLLIGSAVVAAALLNVILVRSVGMFVFGVRRGVGEMLIWAAAVTVPLLWRRVYPEAVVLVTAVVFIAGQVRGAQEIQIASGAIFAAIYSVGAWGRDRGRARWMRIAVIGAMFVWLAVSWLVAADTIPPGGIAGSTGELPPLLSGIVNGILINMLVFGFSYLFGETAWLAARREHQLREQADELRAARVAAEERAVFGERVRIARELHDVVAHHVSVMGIQASAARRAMEKDVVKARGALESVEQSARTAVEELRVMLGALRATEAEPAPVDPAGLERVGDLAEHARAAGLAARAAVFGDPVPLQSSVSQAMYRIAQEAVTNTLKHAMASTVDIRVRYLAREVELDVTDDGVGGPPRSGRHHPGRPGGLGLVGMRERVAVHGGTVEAGPRANGGFRIRARIPTTPPAPANAGSAKPTPRNPTPPPLGPSATPAPATAEHIAMTATTGTTADPTHTPTTAGMPADATPTTTSSAPAAPAPTATTGGAAASPALTTTGDAAAGPTPTTTGGATVGPTPTATTSGATVGPASTTTGSAASSAEEVKR